MCHIFPSSDAWFLRDSNITGLAIDCTSFGDEEIEAETFGFGGEGVLSRCHFYGDPF